MKDQMLEDKYNELGKAHAEAMNQLAKKDEIIKELKGDIDKLSNKITNLERNRMFWVDEVIRLKENKL